MRSALESNVSAAPIKILAVDDREENLLALQALFEDSSYELVSALSGEEALERLRGDDFAAVLLDVQMPVMDGYETARLIHSQERSKNTPIIFVTAIDRNDRHERKGYVSGAVDFLFKPLDPDILLAKVGVFAELFRAKLENQRQAERLQEKALQEQEIRLLQRSLEVRDEFLSIAAHELNTPITPLSLQMQAFLKLVRQRRLREIEPERLERMLETAYGQVGRLSLLVKELVDVSRISNGKLQVNKAPGINLLEIVESVVSEFHEEILRVKCDVRVTAHDKPVGHWDRVRIEQVVINLLSNALKYGLGKPIDIMISTLGDKARLSVQDQGIGIAPDDQKRVFDRFERAVSSQNYGGLGLGLYITTEIVELHGGKIWVESSLGAGSKFIVELPVS